MITESHSLIAHQMRNISFNVSESKIPCNHLATLKLGQASLDMPKLYAKGLPLELEQCYDLFTHSNNAKVSIVTT